MTTTPEQLALLAQYYAEAVENPEAWKNWEHRRNCDVEWNQCYKHLHDYVTFTFTIFRRKPATIEIVCRGKTYTLPHWTSTSSGHRGFEMRFEGDVDKSYAWFDAMREIRGVKA